ncbi:hypothetical protein GCM10020358_40040 [Amorphoplanes nipponensis]|uniref:Uncharacterized protein n=1 Tax=Actinoplanes nipponensis TaxID=135950 RepID=A0A919JN64_9ACTN|nr:hypothetical protein Ani05nite_72450 [Actinoplanes nipponensis]
MGLFTAALTAAAPAVAVAPGAALAAGPVVTRLPIPIAAGADVVAAGDREFISGGYGTSQIAVADAAGAVVATIDGLPGPTDLALSNDRRTLFAALPAANAVAAFDTGTLTESARYDTGADGGCPAHLALAGRYLWFGYGCQAGAGDIGHIDLRRQPARVTLGLAGDTFFYYAPLVTSALRNPSVLLAGETGTSPSEIHSFTVAGGRLTEVSSTRDLGSNLGDLALDPAGATAFVANGAPYYFPSVPAGDLTAPGLNYEAQPYPLAVEVSRDGGRLVGGINGSYEPDVYFYTIGNPAALSTYEVGQGYRVLDGALAWAPNGRKVYAVTSDVYYQPTTNAQLHVIPAPAG